jgi:hypothetical protein
VRTLASALDSSSSLHAERRSEPEIDSKQSLVTQHMKREDGRRREDTNLVEHHRPLASNKV